MNLNNIKMVEQLSTLSVPSFYDHAPNGTSLPFIAIHISQPEGFRADNGNYLKRWDFRIDLYTIEKDLVLEGEVEALLDSLEIPWIQTETYLQDQACYEIEYEFQVMGYPEPEPEPDPPTPPEPDGEQDGDLDG